MDCDIIWLFSNLIVCSVLEKYFNKCLELITSIKFQKFIWYNIIFYIHTLFNMSIKIIYSYLYLCLLFSITGLV